MDMKATREEFALLHKQASEYLELAKNKEVTVEEQAAQDARFAKMDQLQKHLDEAERLVKYAFAKAVDDATPSAGIVLPTKSAAQAAFEASNVGKSAKFDRAEFGKALSDWAATGVMREEFATITSATASGAIYPKQVAGPIALPVGNAIREGMAAIGVTPMSTPGTAAINVPILTVGVGADVAEDASSEVENSLGASGISSVALVPSTIQSGSVWVSELELQSLDYDLLTEVAPTLADAKDQRLEQKIMAAIIADAGITQVVTAEDTDGISYDNLVDLNRGTAKKFDRLKVIFLSDEAYAAAEKLQSESGGPILNRDAQNQQLLRFNGTPVVRASYLEAFGASKTIGVMISFVGFRLRDAGNDKLVRYIDDKDKVGQVGLNLFGYNAYGYVPAAIVKLKTPAS